MTPTEQQRLQIIEQRLGALDERISSISEGVNEATVRVSRMVENLRNVVTENRKQLATPPTIDMAALLVNFGQFLIEKSHELAGVHHAPEAQTPPRTVVEFLPANSPDVSFWISQPFPGNYSIWNAGPDGESVSISPEDYVFTQIVEAFKQQEKLPGMYGVKITLISDRPLNGDSVLCDSAQNI